MSVVNFKRIGNLGSDVVTRFQSSVEQAFKTVNDSLVAITSSGPLAKNKGEGDIETVNSWATIDGGKKYRWYTIGDMCFFEFRIVSTVASTNAEALSFDFPPDVPELYRFSNSFSTEWQAVCNGARAISVNQSLAQNGSSAIFLFNGKLRFQSYTSSTQATKLWVGNCFYRIR